MNKAEWDAMERRRKDGLTLTTFWRAEKGKPIDIHWNDDPEFNTCYPEYIPSGKPWKTHGECDAIRVPHFTTDRNACALVLDEIMDREDYELVSRFDINFFKESGACFGGWHDIDTLRVSPDLICYCAVKAVAPDEGRED